MAKFFKGFFIDESDFLDQLDGPDLLDQLEGRSQVETQGGAERAAMAALQKVVLN